MEGLLPAWSQGGRTLLVHGRQFRSSQAYLKHQEKKMVKAKKVSPFFALVFGILHNLAQKYLLVAFEVWLSLVKVLAI
ncbi:MAG TPA: hypothetical protein DCE56_15295 [Cyanobacteria bacterium UBA8553]|nr:hypothetical protein [Cyanobacteria bacterium UBA8553]HAJ64652.1 hypothetical protein [Cyanobacteria bacterium UBA8543]